MTGDAPVGAWWWWPSGAALQARPLLFFPPAGADQTIVRALTPHLAAHRFGVLRMPGRGPRSDEPQPRAMAGLVTDIARSVEAMPGPSPVLVGHSFGGLLAYAVAHALEGRGRPPARLVTLASLSPRSWAAVLARHGVPSDRDPDPDRVASFVSERVQLLLGQGGIPHELDDDAAVGGDAGARMVTDISLACAALPPDRLACPVTAVTARHDQLVDPDAVAGWADATRAGCTMLTLPGDHFFYRSEPRPLAALLVGELDQLDGAYGSF